MTHFPLVAVLLAASLAAEEAPGPEPEPVITARSELAFDWAPGLWTADLPASEIHFRLEQLDLEVPQAFGWGRTIEQAIPGAGTYQVPASEVFVTRGAQVITPGRWDVRVRLHLVDGTRTGYSEPLVVRVPLPVPTGLRLEEGEEER